VVALIALVIAVLPNIPGFLATVKLLNKNAVPHFFVALYDYAWFVGFAIAFVVYLFLRRIFPSK
jgi:NCS1 family nucleobase:cation symporter-1